MKRVEDLPIEYRQEFHNAWKTWTKEPIDEDSHYFKIALRFYIEGIHAEIVYRLNLDAQQNTSLPDLPQD